MRRENEPANEVQVSGDSSASTRRLGYAIVFVVICILCVVLYALLAGVIDAPAPRTITEAAGAQAEAAVAESPGNGKAWAALASARWAEGDAAGAWDAVEQGQAAVTDHSILYLHTTELGFLMAEGRDDEAYEKAVEYVQAEAEYRAQEQTEMAARGIKVAEGFVDYGETVRLFVLKAAVEGNLGKWDDAILTLDVALELDDKAADVLTLRGWAKYRAGDLAGATVDFEQALKYLPDYASAVEGLATVESSAAAQ